MLRGENILIKFASVVDAVQCAVGVQKELQARNLECDYLITLPPLERGKVPPFFYSLRCK